MRKEWDNNTIGRVFGIIDEMLYSMALYSEIRLPNCDNTIFDPYLHEFWKTISDNAMLMSVIQWCKIFGSEVNNKTHYSHFVDREQFKSKLNNISYEAFSNNMKNVRDKFAAHEDKEEERVAIPSFDTARKIMEAFRKTVQEEYDIPEITSISVTFTAYRLQVRDQLKECRIDWTLPDEDEDKHSFY